MGCTIYGAWLSLSREGFGMLPDVNCCQWVSSPSPRELTSPTPVIQTSDFSVLMCLSGGCGIDLVKPVEHVVFQRIVGEGQYFKHQLAVADLFTVTGNAGAGLCKPGT